MALQAAAAASTSTGTARLRRSAGLQASFRRGGLDPSCLASHCCADSCCGGGFACTCGGETCTAWPAVPLFIATVGRCTCPPRGARATCTSAPSGLLQAVSALHMSATEFGMFPHAGAKLGAGGVLLGRGRVTRLLVLSCSSASVATTLHFGATGASPLLHTYYHTTT